MSAVNAPQAPAPPPTVLAAIGFMAMCVGMFMAILDIQIVATSLPSIQAALGIRPDQMSWLQTSYLIAEVIAIPLTGWLTRVLSLRWLFVAACAAFILASAACASREAFAGLVVWRTVQGFAGGMLIPIVFSAGFTLFPGRGQRLATALAGMLAVVAPTIGPVIGGWLTATWGWPWLFLVNILPGIAAITLAAICLPRDPVRMDLARTVDIAAIVALAIGLATFEIALKEAPTRGWTSPTVVALLAVSIVSLMVFVRRALTKQQGALVDLRALGDRRFALGCVASFILGIGLYGNVYLIPVFLAYVRGFDALEIGMIMLVTGTAQLVAAPFVVWLERFVAAWKLTFLGFGLFAAGLALSIADTPRVGYEEMFWPQVVRGVAIMFCLLPPVRIALGHLTPDRLPDASALFNLMRNLGGAIGLALIDTVIFGGAERHGLALADRLLRFDPTAFAFVGLPMPPVGSEITETMRQMARPAVERAALTLAVDNTWAMIAAISALGCIVALAVARCKAATTRENV